MNVFFVDALKKINDYRKHADLIVDAINNKSIQDWVEGIVLELQTKIPSWKNEDIKVKWSVSGDKVSIVLGEYTNSVDYDELLNIKGAKSSYSGTTIEYDYRETLLFTNIVLRIDFRADIPKEDIEFLKEMNKIVVDTQTTLHSVC